jgi:cytochrome c
LRAAFWPRRCSRWWWVKSPTPWFIRTSSRSPRSLSRRGAADGHRCGPAQDLPPIGPKLAGANVEAGKAIFQKQCFTCHTVDKGGANKVGPNLWGVIGRAKASHAGFSYSSGLQGKGGDWTYEDIDHMIFKPTAYVKGTKMAFAGLPKEQERADVIAFLRTMADSPKPLP